MVHFVYRSHYDNPGCFHVKRFAADSVLAWFQSIWKGVPDESHEHAAHDHAKRLVGRSVYSFGSLFSNIHEHGWPVPKSMRELADRLNDALYVNELSRGAHHVQILTDDDELEMAIYVFDDVYAAKHPDRVAFLLSDDWKLPDGGAHGKFRTPAGVPTVCEGEVAGDGRTYFAAFRYEDSSNLSDLEDYPLRGVIPGVRVGDLPRLLVALDAKADDEKQELNAQLRDVLSGVAPAVAAAKGTERLLLKSVAADPNDVACWCAYSDWCEENGKKPLLERVLKWFHADGSADTDGRQNHRVLVQSHVAQASKHAAQWDDNNLYHYLVFFDDLWANAHPHLAASLLRAAGRWDIL